jgi:hypothetical protein
VGSEVKLLRIQVIAKMTTDHRLRLTTGRQAVNGK